MSSSAEAEQVPRQLFDKTVRVSFEFEMEAAAPNGRQVMMRGQIGREIYFSSLGRIFVRRTRMGEGGRRSRGKGLHGTLDLPPNMNRMRFIHGALVGTRPFASGAAQMTITFDPAYTTCSARVVYGRQSGRAIRMRNLRGRMLTQLGPTSVNDISCTVTPGNGFAH